MTEYREKRIELEMQQEVDVKMEDAPEPLLDLPLVAHQNLGITTSPTVVSNTTVTQAPPRSIFVLPPELLQNIMAHLEPPSQVVLSVTCRVFQRCFQTAYHNISRPRRPFPLGMRESVCGNHIQNYWWNDDHMEGTLEYYATDYEWYPSVGELLQGEIGLWRGLYYCAGCERYKPDEAYKTFVGDKYMLDHRDWWCSRCRAGNMLENEGRQLVTEDDRDVRWGGKLKGYKLLEARPEPHQIDHAALALMTVDEADAVLRHYEPLEVLISKLGI